MNNQEKTIVFFDGVCVLCNATVQFILKHDKHSRFYFASLQSDVAKEFLLHYVRDFEQKDSVLLWYKGKIFMESAAILKIAQILGEWFCLFQVFWIVPDFVRDKIYGIVAKNRYRWFGKKETCMIPDEELKNRFL